MGRRRSDKVADLIRREIATMLLSEIADPRIDFITVVKVSITDDLRIAKVYYTTHTGEADIDAISDGLKSASGYIRKMLAKRVRLKHIPELIFKFDNSLDYAAHIDELLKEISGRK